MRDLFVGDDVAGGVRRAAQADGGGVGVDLEFVEIDFVFEAMVIVAIDAGKEGAKDLIIHSLVAVADVFWNERKNDFAK